MKDTKSIISISLALGMLIYAVPRLEIGQGLTLPTVFSVVWICMALLIISAHLHHIIGVDEETQEEFKRLKGYKRWRLEQMLQGKSNLSRRKKS